MLRGKKKKYYMSVLKLVLVSLIILIIPKYFRDGFGETISCVNVEYSFFETSNPIVVYLLHLYTYLSGALVAFGIYIDNPGTEFTYGATLFRPIIHFINRAFSIDFYEYDLLYDNVFMPISTNVFTYLRESYSDFGYFGVIWVPALWGLLTLLCLKLKMRNTFLRFVILQWVYLYVLYGFFYIPYSQGSPVIGMGMYILFTIVFSKKINRELVSVT